MHGGAARNVYLWQIYQFMSWDWQRVYFIFMTLMKGIHNCVAWIEPSSRYHSSRDKGSCDETAPGPKILATFARDKASVTVFRATHVQFSNILHNHNHLLKALGVSTHQFSSDIQIHEEHDRIRWREKHLIEGERCKSTIPASSTRNSLWEK